MKLFQFKAPTPKYDIFHIKMSYTDLETYRAYAKAVTWKEYKGTKYLKINFTGMDSIDVIRSIKRMVHEMKSQPPKSIRYFLDARDEDVSLATHMTLRKLSKPLQPLIYRSAFIGVTGHKVYLFEAYRKFTHSNAKLFNSEKEALEYICS